MKTRLLSLMIVMLTIMMPTKLWAQELTEISSNYVLVCDELEVRPGKGNLFGDNHFLDVTGGSVATNKGAVDLSVPDSLGENGSPLYVTDYIVSRYAKFGKHLNFLRLKNEQDVISMKVKGNTRLIFFLHGNNKEGIEARIPKISQSADLSNPLNDAPTVNHPTTISGYRYDFVVPEDMQIYIGSYNGDLFVSYIIVEVDYPKPEPYAVLTGDSLLTLYYDDQKTVRGGIEINNRNLEHGAVSPYGTATQAVIDASFANYKPTSTGFWFMNCSSLTTIEGLQNLNTENVGNMQQMFFGCSSLTNLDVTGFNTQDAMNMGGMFAGCSSLTKLDVSRFNTQKVMFIDGMFEDCSSLKSLDVSNFDTQNATGLSWMFYNCSSLKTLDMSSFVTPRVTTTQSMFSGCSGLTTIYAGDGWSMVKVTESQEMFMNCTSLVGGAGTTYDANHIDYTYAHIDGGPSNPGYFTNIADTAKLETVKTPTFRFDYMYDNYLTIETETPGAEIYYTLNGRMLMGEDANFGYNSLKYTNWNVWGDNNQEAKTQSGGYNDSYCLMFTSRTDSLFESAQAGYTFSRALTEGDYYTIRFMARSKSGNGKLQFYCQNDTLPNTRSAADTLTIGSEFADYEVTVKIDNDKTNQFVLNFGAVADTYYIDNVLFGPVISDTTNQLRTLYERPIELRQGVTIKAVAVKQGMKDSEPAVWDYFYEGWMNMLETYERCRMICDMVVGDPNVPLALVHDVRMRLEDMLYRYYERRTEERFDDEELLNAADEMRSYASILESMMRGFIVDGVSYHAVDSTHAEVIASLDYYTPYRNAITVAKEVHYNDLDFQVTSVAQGAFANSDLAAIVWNPTVALKYVDVEVINNPNLLVYVNDASLAPEYITNIVVSKVAKNIELVDASNNNFYCPEPFTAEAISYTREFRQETMIGVSRGWESIALPFDVQTILHEKMGVISPFSRNDDHKHFWLRRLSSNGLVAADKMEANVPYIISMPNSSEYPAEFNLSGRVTFSSANVTVPVTETRTLALADSTIMMASTMQRLGRSSSYYALNVGEVRGQYLEGSVFERDYREIRPFEAYTIHRGDTPAPRFMPINELNGGTTGIDDVRSLMSDGRGDNWYDLNGRKLQQKPKQKGVYINGKHKMIVK